MGSCHFNLHNSFFSKEKKGVLVGNFYAKVFHNIKFKWETFFPYKSLPFHWYATVTTMLLLQQSISCDLFCLGCLWFEVSDYIPEGEGWWWQKQKYFILALTLFSLAGLSVNYGDLQKMQQRRKSKSKPGSNQMIAGYLTNLVHQCCNYEKKKLTAWFFCHVLSSSTRKRESKQHFD